MTPKVLETINDHGYWASLHTHGAVVRLRITNPQMPTISSVVLEILTGEGHAAALWLTGNQREELAEVLELMAKRLRQNADFQEIVL
jgi:hypothetical protein